MVVDYQKKDVYNKNIMTSLIKFVNYFNNKDYSQYGSFIIEPLNIGQGITLGNTLRRTLLSDISSFAITGLRINNLKHEFSVFLNLREDIFELILNLKQIIFKESFFNLKLKKNKFITSYLLIKENKIITASLFNLPKNIIKILNPNQYICTNLTNSNLYIEIDIEKGNSYTFKENKTSFNSTILIDSNFIPIKNVNYKVKIIYDNFGNIKESLNLEIVTNGSITPYRSLQESFKILLNLFSFPIISLDLINFLKFKNIN